MIDALFQRHKNRRSDINEHMTTLKEYAMQCESVLELGVRKVVSSWAFAYGLLQNGSDRKLLFCNDVSPCDIQQLKTECEKASIILQYEWCSDLDLHVEDNSFDMVFIDTLHVYGQLKRELNKFGKVAKKYIVLHDTTVDGEYGEAIRCHMNVSELSKQTGIPADELTKGLRYALDEFLSTHVEWSVCEVFTNNNGLTILKRR